MNLLERVRQVLRTEEAKSGGRLSVGWLCLAPALLAAIFVGQTTFAGSLNADEGDREGAVAATEPGNDEPERGEEAKDGEDDPGSREEEEEGDDDEAEDRDEQGDDDEEEDEEEGEREGPVADLRRQFAAEKAHLEESLRAEAQALEQKYKAHMAAAQAEMAEAMAKLQAVAQSRTKELEHKFAEAVAKRQGERRADEGDREGVPGGDADDLTPRERRMLEVIRSLENRLRELESRLPRDGERREGGDHPREERRDGDRPSEERREGDQPRVERRVEERAEPRSEEEAKERQMGAVSERLYKALRSDELSDERRAEFARRAILDVFGYELNEEQVKIVLERSRGEFDGFRQLMARLSQARKE